MTKVEIDGKEYQVVQSRLQIFGCDECAFKFATCPRSDEWPWNALCTDYEDVNTNAYFKEID